jgi:iron(III) transport system ATP-binding protein
VTARVVSRSYVGGRWQVGLDLGGGPVRLETDDPPAEERVRLWLPAAGGILFRGSADANAL